jgi:hypothetical protein
LLEPIDAGNTRATYMAEIDLKGSIPGFVVKTANQDQGYQISKLRDALTKLKAT